LFNHGLINVLSPENVHHFLQFQPPPVLGEGLVGFQTQPQYLSFNCWGQSGHDI